MLLLERFERTALILVVQLNIHVKDEFTVIKDKSARSFHHASTVIGATLAEISQVVKVSQEQVFHVHLLPVSFQNRI